MRLPDTSNSERHERIRKESDGRFLLRQVMNLIFIVGVAALIIRAPGNTKQSRLHSVRNVCCIGQNSRNDNTFSSKVKK